jgi:hypothetical protein
MRREKGSLYKQQRSSYWWVRIGFRGRLICASTKTADKRQALEVLKAKRRELEAAKGGFINLPSAGASKVTVREMADALVAEYRVREKHSIPTVVTHLKRVCEELGEMRVTDLRSKTSGRVSGHTQGRWDGRLDDQPRAGAATPRHQAFPRGAAVAGAPLRSVAVERA